MGIASLVQAEQPLEVAALGSEGRSKGSLPLGATVYDPFLPESDALGLVIGLRHFPDQGFAQSIASDQPEEASERLPLGGSPMDQTSLF